MQERTRRIGMQMSGGPLSESVEVHLETLERLMARANRGNIPADSIACAIMIAGDVTVKESGGVQVGDNPDFLPGDEIEAFTRNEWKLASFRKFDGEFVIVEIDGKPRRLKFESIRKPEHVGINAGS